MTENDLKDLNESPKVMKAIIVKDDDLLKAIPLVHSESIMDSIIAKWSRSFMTLIIIPIMLAGIYHIWDAVEHHSNELSGISVAQNDIKASVGDIKESIGELKNSVVALAQKQSLDEINIAGLQQSDIDRHSFSSPPPAPAPAPAPVTEPSVAPEHHAFIRRASPQNDLVTAIQKIFSPPHGVRARAVAKVGGR